MSGEARTRPARPSSGAVVAAVARRELGALFGQPAAWVFLAAFLAVASLLGLRGFFERGVSDLRDAFAALRWAFVLLAPAASMRLLAEERRARTLELLFTLPIRPAEAVLGKYLAGLGLIAASLVLAAAVPLSLAPFAAFDLGQVVAGALGAFLLGATFLAVGLLASALTRSQEVAFLVGAAACLGLNLLGDPLVTERLASALGGAWRVTGGALALGVGYDALTRGVLDGQAVVAFAALTGLALLGAVVAVERREPGRRVVPTLLLAGAAALLAVNLAGTRTLRLRADLTFSRRNSLTQATRDLVARARGELTVRAYLSEGIPEGARPLARRLLDLLSDLEAASGGRVRVEVIDPRTPDQQAAAERQGVKRFQLQVREGDDGTAIRTVYAGVVVFYEGRAPAAIPVALDPSLDLEYELALAVRRLLQPRRVVALAGAGVSDYGAARAALARFCEVRDLDLTQAAQVPEDVSLVLFAAPAPPSDREAYALDQFVARGGRLVLLVEGHGRTGMGSQVGVHDLGALGRALQGWGIAVGPGLVAQVPHRTFPLKVGDSVAHVYFPWFVVPTAEANVDTPLGRGLGSVLFPFVSELSWVGDAGGATRTALLWSEPAWALDGVQDVDPRRDLRPVLQGAERVRRLLALGVRGRLPSAWAGRPGVPLASGAPDDPLATPLAGPTAEGCVVVVGDADFVRPQWLAQGDGGVDLLLDLVEWTTGDGSLGAVRARGQALPLRHTDATVLGAGVTSWVWALDVVLFPLAVLAFGIGRLLLAERRREAAASRERAAAGAPGEEPA